MGLATNPILDEINGLSPGAKTALLSAHSASAPPDINAGAQAPKIDAGTQQAAAKLQAPGAAPGPAMMGAPPMPSPAPNLGAPPALPHASLPVPGTVQGDTLERQRLLDTGSGIHQIKNPVLKGLAGVGNAVGSILAPGLMREIPGTEEHHNLLLGKTEANLGNDLGTGEKEATIGNTQSLTGKNTADTREANDRANLLEHPRPDYKPTDTSGGILGYDPATNTFAAPTTPSGQPEQPYVKPGPYQHVTVMGPDGKPQFANYQDGKYLDALGREIPNAQPYEKSTEQHVAMIGDDGKTTFGNYQNGVWTDPSGKPIKNPRPIPPPTPAGAIVLNPSTQGGYDAQAVHPGSHIGPGAVTVSGMNTVDTPTSQSRNMAEMAKTVLPQMTAISNEVDQMASAIGPSIGRWNQLMVNKGGKDYPQFAKLDTDLDLLASAIVRTHFGARGGQQYREELRKQFGEAQSPDDLKARIAGANSWLQGYAHMADNGASGSGSGGGANAPKEGETKTNSAGDKVTFKGGKWGPA